MNLTDLKKLAKKNHDISKIPDWMVREAILIRLVEEKFIDLFSQGKMNGTVHTCVGQEFSATAVAGQLMEFDWVTSNIDVTGTLFPKQKIGEGCLMS